jgi:hypothetical protein
MGPSDLGDGNLRVIPRDSILITIIGTGSAIILWVLKVSNNERIDFDHPTCFRLSKSDSAMTKPVPVRSGIWVGISFPLIPSERAEHQSLKHPIGCFAVIVTSERFAR